MTDDPDLFKYTRPPIRLGPGGQSVILNPGTGPVPGATRGHADGALRAFVNELEARGWPVAAARPTGGDPAEGRYPYELTFTDGRTVTVDMPGLPVEQVRWMGEPGQNIWHYPRLYVDGSSWVWKYAIDQCGPDEGDDDDDE